MVVENLLDIGEKDYSQFIMDDVQDRSASRS